ncbi:MAG: FHA domain-containing protein [Isosphaeraceae bacterium]
MPGQTTKTTTGQGSWSLEVIRGREIGRVYRLVPGAIILGNGPKESGAIDLAAMEAGSPRRMAARQAEVIVSRDPAEKPTVRDLESPGGTFVNRQRLLAGQVRRLDAGDVLQLGAVQLRVVAPANGASTPSPSVTVETAPATKVAPAVRPGPLPAPFRLASGATCRTWDDFLTLSAQSWSALRDELSSGRLGAFLASQGLAALKPDLARDGSADERLDTWLSGLPTTRAATPQVDVHPEVVRIRAVPGGGVTRAKVVITNTGYRLLRSTLRVENPGVDWLVVPPGSAGPWVTPDQTEIAFEVRIPETVAQPLSAALIIDGNGGVRRVEVRIEPAPRGEAIPEGTSSSVGETVGTGNAPLASVSPPQRVLGGAILGACGWLIVLVGDRVGQALVASAGEHPAVGGPATLALIVGGVLGALGAGSRGAASDRLPGGIAGGIAAALLAAIHVAFLRALGPSGSGWILSAFASIGLGGLIGGLSVPFVPFEAKSIPPMRSS